MKQETFTDIEYSCRKKKTKREEFLEIMDEIIPWDEWVGVIKPYYPAGDTPPEQQGRSLCCHRRTNRPNPPGNRYFCP